MAKKKKSNVVNMKNAKKKVLKKRKGSLLSRIKATLTDLMDKYFSKQD